MPGNFKPNFYEITIRPYIGPKEVWKEKSFTFDGFVKIYFKCKNPARKIVFHSKELELNSIALVLNNKNQDTVELDENSETDKEKDFVIIKLTKDCTLNQDYILMINYSGSMMDKLNGFYVNSYNEQDGKIK